jgi:hypothetical protein
MHVLEIFAAFVIGFGLATFLTLYFTRTSAYTTRLADPKPFAAELYGPIVEVEVSHPFRSAPDLTTFPNMALACSFLAETFTAGGFSQIVLTAIDDPESPADVPDWWEAEKSLTERAIEKQLADDETEKEQGR